MLALRNTVDLKSIYRSSSQGLVTASATFFVILFIVGVAFTFKIFQTKEYEQTLYILNLITCISATAVIAVALLSVMERFSKSTKQYLTIAFAALVSTYIPVAALFNIVIMYYPHSEATAIPALLLNITFFFTMNAMALIRLRSLNLTSGKRQQLLKEVELQTAAFSGP